MTVRRPVGGGLSWVPITPFVLKDWERWEDGEDERPARLEGVRSVNGRLAPHRFDPAHRTPTIVGRARRRRAGPCRG